MSSDETLCGYCNHARHQHLSKHCTWSAPAPNGIPVVLLCDCTCFQEPTGGWPKPTDMCKCGHVYADHNYSDSLPSTTGDPYGHLYECRGDDGEKHDETGWCVCRAFRHAKLSQVKAMLESLKPSAVRRGRKPTRFQRG